ncbi:hypothetical protein HL033_02270 [Neoehrlichia mikurensis]|uniref:Uncharacterized protein n=1 Tax=Neoehrlichia mikurensis TaxID=89586 RepID=A0A9Q9F3Z4_9RICK|nr:hypothetical protein [Neoehrlichia mikurensis]QXK91591.1 hypothetical protein IAH97_02265 [Neoehrlichia mikurensis]QXK92802.1 hypothetical protein HUN61_02260 [Neoehrlichia mikurensis]QXK93281.1 hypothetical protein HL033_02270 [Neoehrlichia mikurensis]UTO55789.1 hypothetical protein LUA82_01810 [Neoehrlichia mikurensis]UTO56704.1 hypothetical protein LUA81_01795 [Neoehrlichia mikurensis]
MYINGLFYIEVYQYNHISNHNVIYGGKVHLISNSNDIATFDQILWILGGLGAFESFKGNIKCANQSYNMQISIGKIVEYNYDDLKVKEKKGKSDIIIFYNTEARKNNIKIMLQQLII